MNERNMIRSNHQVLEYANGQQLHNHHQHDPCFIVGNQSSFPPSNYNTMPPPSGNLNNFDLHHLPDRPVGPVFYGPAHYNQPNHPATNLDLGGPQPSSYLAGHINPTSGTPRVFRVPPNHGFMDQLPSSSNYRGNEVPFSEHGRGICKTKNAEGIPGFSSSAGPSSSTAAIDAPLGYNDYRSNGTHPMVDGIQMDSGMVHEYNNYLVQGNYGGQSFQPSSCTWMEPHSNNGGALSWNGYNNNNNNPMLGYFPGTNIHGSSSESVNAGPPPYPESSISHGSASYLHSPPMVQPHPSLLHPPQNISRTGGYFTCYPPSFAPPHSRVSPNGGIQHDPVHHSPETTGIRVHRSHGRSPVSDATSSRRNDFRRLRMLQNDRNSFPGFPSFYEVDYDAENLVDHHRDMRLDIDDMSYEELLALSEQIGTVSTGLSEEDIRCGLKTRLYSSSTCAINLEELPCIDQNNDSCIICQDEYEETDKVGILECGHEYHVECLKKWLLVKNVCPVCKSSALTTISNH